MSLHSLDNRNILTEDRIIKGIRNTIKRKGTEEDIHSFFGNFLSISKIDSYIRIAKK